MSWMAIASVASAGLNFIGGRKKAKAEKRARARDEYLNSPQGIRDEAEKAGFNPLTVLESGRSFGAGYAPQFGNELGQLGQGLVEAATGHEQLKIQRAELDMQQQRLEHLQKATTLGEKVPGIYGARNAGTSNRSGKTGGVSNDADNLDNAGSLRAARLGGAADASNYIKAEAPAFKAFNIPFYGSGAWSSGQGFEDALGEGPFSWVFGPFIAADAIGHEIGNANSRRQQRNLDAKADEWFRRSRENDPIKTKKLKPPKREAPYMPPLDKKTARRKVMRSSNENWGGRFLQSFYP